MTNAGLCRSRQCWEGSGSNRRGDLATDARGRGTLVQLPGAAGDCHRACRPSGEDLEGRALCAGRAPGSQPAPPERIRPPVSSVPHPRMTARAKRVLPIQPAEGIAANPRGTVPGPSGAKRAGGGSAHAESALAAAALPDPHAESPGSSCADLRNGKRDLQTMLWKGWRREEGALPWVRPPPNPRAVQPCACAATEGAGGSTASASVRPTPAPRGSTSP